MQIFSKDKTYNFMKLSPLFLGISAVLIIASYGMLFTKGLSYGIDFSGGTLVQVKYDKVAPIKDIRKALSKVKIFENASVTEFGSPQEVVIRFSSTSGDVGSDVGDRVSSQLKGTGTYEVRRVDIVGPKVGGELREKGLMAMAMSILAILLYIAFRFEWRFAIASVIALIHDISITIGALVIFGIDINLDILAALLTLLGYSLNDTIIVFDRIREGIRETKVHDLFKVINESVSKTLSRTFLTSLTTFFVVLTSFLFGGEIIRGFGFTLLIGIIVGTYSSVFIASPMLKVLGFDVSKFKASEAEKEKRKIQKEKLRAQYEQGVV